VSTLLVASAGGHLAQLYRLAPRLRGDLDRDFIWVTFDTSQSRSLLASERVVYVRHTHSRDYYSVALNALRAPRLLRRHHVSAVVTTGSGIALSFIPAARALGIPAHYIESAARTMGPSLTGRALSRVPGVQLYTQYPEWADGRWRHAGSVIDAFTPTQRPSPPGVIRRAVVTLGTSAKYGFRRLVERLADVFPQDAEVLWQTGATDVRGVPIDAKPALPGAVLDRAMREADVVVAHAGIGSALAALEAGHCPVLVPRRERLGECVDDHQLQIASTLSARGLAIERAAEGIEHEDLLAAAARAVGVATNPPAFELSMF